MKSYLKYLPDHELYKLLADVQSEVDRRSKVKPAKKEVEETEMIKKYREFCKEKAPDVLKMAQQPSHDEFYNLVKKHGAERVKDILVEMNNWKPLLSKRKNVCQTADTWLRNNGDSETKVVGNGVSM